MTWVVIAIAVVLVLLVAVAGRSKQTEDRQAGPFRIDHPHYMTDDESECSVCYARFRYKASNCPRCGARFEFVKSDEEEWDEEFEEECEWDEEEGQ